MRWRECDVRANQLTDFAADRVFIFDWTVHGE